ncbi:MAG: AEC family transporter [Oscillospiraceae bacterium]
MRDLIYSLNIVLPLFLIGVLGYFLRVKGIVDMNFMDKGVSLCFKLLLPFMLFNEIYTSDIVGGFNPKTFAFGVIGTFISIFLTFVYAKFCIKSEDKRSAIAHGIFRSNFIMMGVPIVENMYGAGSTVNAAALLPIVIPMFNVAAILVFTLYAPRAEGEKRVSVKSVIMKIVKNPLIIAVFVAAVFKILNIKLPTFAMTTVSYIARTSTTMSLLTIGGLFEVSQAKKNLKYSLATCFARLIIVPFIAISIAVALGFKGVDLATLLILFGSPTAVSSAAMAKNLGGDYKLSGDITMLSAFFSIFTMFGFIFILKSLSLL